MKRLLIFSLLVSFAGGAALGQKTGKLPAQSSTSKPLVLISGNGLTNIQTSGVGGVAHGVGAGRGKCPKQQEQCSNEIGKRFAKGLLRCGSNA